jgi:sugar lactone lactonase YvrE
VDVPATNVTSCAFGGPDLRTLYITTAAGPGRSAGAIFTCQVAVPGLPANPYLG